jgi:hypothetical protein
MMMRFHITSHISHFPVLLNQNDLVQFLIIHLHPKIIQNKRLDAPDDSEGWISQDIPKTKGNFRVGKEERRRERILDIVEVLGVCLGMNDVISL